MTLTGANCGADTGVRTGKVVADPNESARDTRRNHRWHASFKLLVAFLIFIGLVVVR